MRTVKKPKKPFHNKKNRKRPLDSYINTERIDIVNTDSVSSEISLIWVREIYEEMNKN